MRSAVAGCGRDAYVQPGNVLVDQFVEGDVGPRPALLIDLVDEFLEDSLRLPLGRRARWNGFRQVALAVGDRIGSGLDSYS
jgi:hypothetical protein